MNFASLVALVLLMFMKHMHVFYLSVLLYLALLILFDHTVAFTSVYIHTQSYTDT